MQIKASGYSVHTKPYFSNHTRQRPLPHYLLRLQVEGVSQAVVNETAYPMSPGDLLLCRPGDDYYLMIPLQAGDPPVPVSADYYTTLESEDLWVKQWWERYEGHTLLTLGSDEVLLGIWEQVVTEKRRIKDTDPMILEHLTRALMLHIARLTRTDQHANVYERSIANQIKLYIERNATERLTLKDIASAVGLSVSRASQVFKATLNQSIMDYAIEVRLTMARERMLYEGMTLQEAAGLCGFANYTHFNRLFRARFRMSPSEYVRLMQAKS